MNYFLDTNIIIILFEGRKRSCFILGYIELVQYNIYEFLLKNIFIKEGELDEEIYS